MKFLNLERRIIPNHKQRSATKKGGGGGEGGGGGRREAESGAAAPSVGPSACGRAFWWLPGSGFFL